jgi:hypothetical protein
MIKMLVFNTRAAGLRVFAIGKPLKPRGLILSRPFSTSDWLADRFVMLRRNLRLRMPVLQGYNRAKAELKEFASQYPFPSRGSGACEPWTSQLQVRWYCQAEGWLQSSQAWRDSRRWWRDLCHWCNMWLGTYSKKARSGARPRFYRVQSRAN